MRIQTPGTATGAKHCHCKAKANRNTSNHHNCCEMPTYKAERYCKNTNLPATATGEPSHLKAKIHTSNRHPPPVHQVTPRPTTHKQPVSATGAPGHPKANITQATGIRNRCIRPPQGQQHTSNRHPQPVLQATPRPTSRKQPVSATGA